MEGEPKSDGGTTQPQSNDEVSRPAGNTIAGRALEGGALSGDSANEPQTVNAKDGPGVTGLDGREAGEGDDVTKGAAAGENNPGQSETGSSR